MKLAALIQLAIAITTLSLRAELQSQEFECSGTLIYQVFGPGEQNVTNYFEVTVSGNKILTLTSNVHSHKCMQVAMDSGIIYILNSYPGGARAGTVKSGDWPDANENRANILWLAYASSSYFQKVKTNQLRPIWMLDDPHLAQDGFTVQADWSKSTQPPFLPKKIIYFNDGFSRHFTNGKRATNSVPAPFDQGYTNAVYETFSVTHQSGLEIPSELKFTRFYISEKQLRPRDITTVKVTDFKSKISTTTFRPKFSGSVSVADRRFFFPGSQRAVSYKAKDGVWPTFKDVQPLFEKELKRWRPQQMVVPQPAS